MVVVLSGITGVGKSYFKRNIIKKLGFKNIVIVTTRVKRKKEINGIDKHFVTKEQFKHLKNTNKLSVPFEFLGNMYAYYTNDILNLENSITELHYNTISQFKKVAKNVVSIYIMPKNIKYAKEQLKMRKLPKEIEKERLKEIEQQILEIEKKEDLKNEFDYIIYNDYTEKSLQNIIKLIKDLVKQDSLCLKEG